MFGRLDICVKTIEYNHLKHGPINNLHKLREKYKNKNHFSYNQNQIDLLEDPGFNGDCYEKVNIAIIHEFTPKSIKNECSKLALYFKRMFGYDFFGYDGWGSNDKHIIYYWYIKQMGYINIIGFCIFENTNSGWGLAATWLHPYYQNHGVLSYYWQKFKNIFGDFWVQPPFSKTMTQFLKKKNYDFKKNE